MKREDITKLFPDATKEQIDQIMSLNGADINAAKAGMDQLRAQHQTELQQAKDDASAALQKETAAKALLQKQLDDLTAANTLRDLKDKISGETGVPVKLLSGSTEEELKTQAEAIKAFAGTQNGYPTVKDGGEVRTPGEKKSTAKQFEDWFNTQIK